MTHEIYMHFRIMEFISSPEDVVRQLNLTNVKTWRKGDVISPRTGKLYDYHGLEIGSGLTKEDDFDSHLSAILSVIEPRLPAFTEVCSSCYTELSCAIYLYHESEKSTPAVHLHRQATEILAALGAELDIDLYAL